MWNVDGAYLFYALDSGAVGATGVDVRDVTEEFNAQNERRGSRARFFRGDVNDASLVERVGPADVVFCSGVLYHMPNPILTLEQLKRLSRPLLILGSATIPELAVPHGAIYYPFLDERARRALTYRTPHPKIGLDTDYRPEWDYSNFFWGLTPSCIDAMLQTVGFRVVERFKWRHSLCVVCSTGE
jgi:SAM-dependent methyltransferase